MAIVLAQISSFSGRTILYSAAISGTVSANVVNQPWDVALKAALNASGYDFVVNADNIIVVDTIEAIEKRRAAVGMRDAIVGRDTDREGLRPNFGSAVAGGGEGLGAMALAERQALGLEALSNQEEANIDRAGCGAARGDSTTFTILVSDDDAARGGRLVVSSASTSVRGARVEFFGEGPSAPSQACSVGRTGAIRLFGRRVMDGSRIIVHTAAPAVLVARTGSGKLVAGPMRVANEDRTIALEWTGRGR